ncbi:SPOR domain-containing protein [Paraperlucidibaca wandonensis]|uniref:SPOR domain-containing protein n=1 Tax=Paraperlucidibaca wandonensis TaxID=1268273 RepID=A0ABW3HGC3_9GAMM
MPPGRLILFVLLAGLLGYGIWTLQHRPSEEVEGVPAALSSLDEAPQQAPAANTPAKKPAERFEFYDILPNQRVLPSRTPDARSAPRPQAKTPATTPEASEQSSTRWLQVGAFRNGTQANERLAELKSLNIPAQRQSGFDAQGKPLERIVAGPFDSARHLADARARLATEGLDAIPLSSLGDSQ